MDIFTNLFNQMSFGGKQTIAITFKECDHKIITFRYSKRQAIVCKCKKTYYNHNKKT